MFVWMDGCKYTKHISSDVHGSNIKEVDNITISLSTSLPKHQMKSGANYKVSKL